MLRFIKSLFPHRRFYFILSLIVVLFVLGYFYSFIFFAAKIVTLAFVSLVIADLLFLYSRRNGIAAKRETPERFSNGDENNIRLSVKNNYPVLVTINIIDELPFQFQMRDFSIKKQVAPKTEKTFLYKLRPTQRGEYDFGRLNIFVKSVVGLIERRYRFNVDTVVPTYPSFIQMRNYELMAISNRLTEVGIKKIRRVSNTNEFDQIREYVQGDDYRTVNWKATARQASLMVNQYQDERSQHLYSIIDMGRTMKMPFENMTLLDYAINASLVISNIAIYKHDRAGLITFSKKIETLLPAHRKNSQMLMILEMLYKQKTNFAEPNYELLYATIRRKLKQRSLLLLFTNFEGFTSMKRQLPYFKRIAANHLLVVIFFENTEIKKLLHKRSKKLSDVYIKTIAEKFMYEKRLIVKELKKYGIHAILTEPANLNVQVINKYLELKAIGQI